MVTVVGADGDERDVILHAEPGTTVSQVARLLGAERLYAGQAPLNPEWGLPEAAIRDGRRIGLDAPAEDDPRPAASAALGTVLPLVQVDDGGLLVNRPSRHLFPPSTLPTSGTSFALPPPPAGKRFAWPPRRKRELRDYVRERQKVEAAADSELTSEADHLRNVYPGPRVVSFLASAPGFRLWERRPGDPGFLEVRTGTGDRMSRMTLTDPATGQSRQLQLRNVPTTIRLSDRLARGGGVLCVRGAAAMARGACRWLVAQLAVLHSPEDVRVCLLADPAAREDWEWIRWLPHCRPPGDGTVPAWIGNGPATASARIAELVSAVETRRGMEQPSPAIVVIVDDWSRLRRDPGIRRLLRDGPEAGVYAICLDPDDDGPPERSFPLTGPGKDRAWPRTLWAGRPGNSGARAESVDAEWCERLARALAPLRDADTRRGVPEASRLLDVLRLAPPAPEAILRRWVHGEGAPAAVIGESSDGPFGIDLRRDGPHALIAGTSGAGKSELLRTIVASLAASGPPDAIAFLLLDYKGGSAFGDCADLPHTAGVIVDFDSREADRVLASLAAELSRRELLLNEAAARDIDDYAETRDRQPKREPLPRLVIVVDEFASLAREVPDFVPGLVSVAQRGRSLGLHLILATQRPAGVLSAGIRANTNLRIALRVIDPDTSRDVIDSPDAASIPRSLPGRSFIRTQGADPVLVQTCQVGGTAPAPFVTPADWEHLGQPARHPWPAPGEESATDLASLVGAIRRAGERLGIPPPHRPWLPGLPGAIALGELRLPARGGDGRLPPVPYGLEDLPSEQAQRTVAVDFATFGHLLAGGDRLSGRSQLLRTLAGAVAATVSCADVHLYAIDSGDGVLLPLAELPHCGAVVTLAQADRAARLITRLGRELDRRRELLAVTRHRTIGDQRLNVSRPQRLPHVLILIDRWESFTDALGDVRSGALTDTIMRILRDGQPFGLHLVITGGRGVLTGRLAAAAGDKLAFRLADRDDYALIGLRGRDVPYDIPAGRAFRAGPGTEMQVALLDGSPTGSGQAAALRALAETARTRDAHVALAQRPFQVEAADLVSDRFHVGDTQGRPVGREDVLAWLRARHAAGGSVALLGPRRAGKTWVLRELERRLAGDGHQRVHSVTIQLPSSRVDTPDELARILDRSLRGARSPAQRLLDGARDTAGTPDRLSYLLDEVGRLAAYGPAAVSWLRDLGQAGAWLVYTGTEKDWQDAVRQALRAPGSSFGNDVDARPLGPLDERDAVTFLVGTAASLRVNLTGEMASAIVSMVGAWPFYLQVVGDAVVRAVQADDLKPLWDTSALRDLVDARLLDGWMTHFKGRWAEIGPAGRSALLADPGRRPGDPAPGQREDLRDVGLLLPGDRWLADPPFFDWIARNAVALRDGERR